MAFRVICAAVRLMLRCKVLKTGNFSGNLSGCSCHGCRSRPVIFCQVSGQFLSGRDIGKRQ